MLSDWYPDDIGEEDLEKFWKRSLPKKYWDLLDAAGADVRMDAPGKGWNWDWVKQRFTKEGQEADQAKVMDWIKKRAEADIEKEVNAYLKDGNTRRFKERMKAGVITLHSLAGTLGYGGTAGVKPKQLKETVDFHLKKLDEFVKDLPNLSEAQIRNRASAYAKSAEGTFNQSRAKGASEAGYKYAISHTRPAEHCPECLRLDGVTLPIEQMIPVGQRECLWNCKCWIEYLKELPRTDSIPSWGWVR